MDKETISNYKAIEELVLSRFDLMEESKEIFSKLLFNPDDPIEFEKIYSQPDRRLFVDCKSSEKENSNWMSFKDCFRNFVNENKITVENFNDGKVDKKKLTTVFIEYTSNNLSGLFEVVLYLKNKDRETFRVFCENYFPKNANNIMDNINSLTITATPDGRLAIKFGKKTTKKKFNPKEVSLVIKELKTPISSLLNKDFFGTKPFSGPKICFSLNYADWFMSSTGESWFSCVDFKNQTGNWRGLAGLVGDKNRIIIFITDGTKKTFNGVEAYKMRERTWAFLLKDKDGTIRLCANRTYPSGNIDLSKYSDIFPKGIGYGRQYNNTYLSAYSFPTLFHKPHSDMSKGIKYSSSIAEDNHAKKLNPDNINESFYDTSGSYGIYTYAIGEDGKVLPNRTINKQGSF